MSHQQTNEYVPFDARYMGIGNPADENKDDKKSDYVPINFAYAPVIGLDSPNLARRLEISNLERLAEDSYGYNAQYYRTNNYFERFLESKTDFSQRLLKFLIIGPKSKMHGVWAYTWLGDSRMVRRDDVIAGSEFAFELDDHEGGHTTDEYETIVRSRWKREKPDRRYIL